MFYPTANLYNIIRNQKKILISLLLVELLIIIPVILDYRYLIPVIALIFIAAILNRPIYGLVIMIFYIFLITVHTKEPGPFYFIKFAGLPLFITEMFMILIIVSFLARYCFSYGSDKLPKINILDKIVLIYSAVGIWGMLLGYYHGAGLRDMINIIRYFSRFPMAYFTARLVIRSEDDISIVIRSIFVAGALMTLKWFIIHVIRLSAGVPLSTPIILEHENLFFTFFSISGLYLFISGLHSKKRYFPLFVLSLFNLYLLLFSFRRAFWVSLLIGAILMIIYMWKNHRRGVLRLAFVIPFIIIILTAAGGYDIIYSRAATITTEYNPEIKAFDSNATRILENYNVYKAFLKDPILGKGFGVSYEPTIPYPWPTISHTMIHNCYGTIWIWIGTPGIIALLLLFIYFIRYSYKLFKRSINNTPSRLIGASTCSLFMAFLIAVSFAHYMFYIRPPIFMGIMGVIIAVAYFENKSIKL